MEGKRTHNLCGKTQDVFNNKSLEKFKNTTRAFTAKHPLESYQKTDYTLRMYKYNQTKH